MFGILGYGYVGRATQHSLINNEKCVVYDTKFDVEKDILVKCHTVFVCIPTDSESDVTGIVNEIQYLQSFDKDIQFVIRSTLPLGACEQIQSQVGKIIYMPEFLRERNWEEDCMRRPLVVGHDKLQLPEWLLQHDIVECTTKEAELVKMFQNNFAIIRIAFANVFYDLAESVGADYSHIKNMFLKTQHDQTYLDMPGHDGTRGFGGKCLPKDLEFLISMLKKHKLDHAWFKQISESNKKWQKQSL